MNEEFIPYEQALALKELGFNWPCINYYSRHGLQKKPEICNRIEDSENIQLPHGILCPNRDGMGNIIHDVVVAPLYQQAFRWFTKTHNLKFYIREDIWNHWCDVKVLFNQEYVSVGEFDSYDKAELACLKKLIEIVDGRTN